MKSDLIFEQKRARQKVAPPQKKMMNILIKNSVLFKSRQTGVDTEFLDTELID